MWANEKSFFLLPTFLHTELVIVVWHGREKAWVSSSLFHLPFKKGNDWNILQCIKPWLCNFQNFLSKCNFSQSFTFLNLDHLYWVHRITWKFWHKNKINLLKFKLILKIIKLLILKFLGPNKIFRLFCPSKLPKKPIKSERVDLGFPGIKHDSWIKKSPFMEKNILHTMARCCSKKIYNKNKQWLYGNLATMPPASF